jgi:hypothetical protein
MILQCTKCKLEKDESEFPASESKIKKRNYRGYWCNECKRAAYHKRADIVCERQRKYYHENRETVVIRKRKSYKKYYENNKDKCLNSSKAWAKGKREELAKIGEVYNAEYMRIYRKEYCKTYRKLPRVIAASKLRGRFRDWLLCKKGTKKSSVLQLVGMPKEEFRIYIESQFTEGMTWQNIHIDHYIPLSYFDHESEEHQAIAWNYRNLRPMFPKDNISKGCKLPPDYLEHIEMIKRELNISSSE